MIKYCQWCDKQFSSSNKNQIYCNAECRKLATKQKILQRYKVTKVKSRSGKERKCAGGCDTTLSIYNDVGFCNTCMMSKRKLDQALKEIKDYFDYEEK
jgi:hypothetical protein